MNRLLAAVLLLLSIAALWVGHEHAQNGRYQFSPSSRTIIDTRTGAVYVPNATTALAEPVIKPIE